MNTFPMTWIKSYSTMRLFVITDFYSIHDPSVMRNTSVSTWMVFSHAVLFFLLCAHVPKENVARIMYTMLLRSHWMTLPKAEQHAWWVGNVVGLIGKAQPMARISQKVPSEVSYGLRHIGWLTAKHSAISASNSVLWTSNIIIRYGALLI